MDQINLIRHLIGKKYAWESNLDLIEKIEILIGEIWFLPSQLIEIRENYKKIKV